MATNQTKIDYQEKLDAYVVGNCIKEQLLPTFEFTQTPSFTNYDLSCTWNDKKIAIEIKERWKKPEYMQRYQCAELKESKRDLIFSATTGFDFTYYAQLLNHDWMIIFYLPSINWNECPLAGWQIKNTQYSDATSMTTPKTYNIPWSMASKCLPIRKYYTEYEQANPEEYEYLRKEWENDKYTKDLKNYGYIY